MSAQDTQPTNGISGAARPEGRSLGSSTKSASRITGKSNRALKFALQAAARELHPDGRIRVCLRMVQPNRDTVEVWHNATENRAFYRGLIRCGQLWVCPVCASWITERRRKALSALLSARREITDPADLSNTRSIYVPVWYTGLATFTISHHHGEPLSMVKARLDAAYHNMFSGRWAVAWKQKNRVVGTIRALEVTHGENGWHPHYHTLFVHTDKSSMISILEIERDLRNHWLEASARAKVATSFDYGVKYDGWDVGAVEYLSKMSQHISAAYHRWDVVSELTKAPAKRGRLNGLTTWELLADYMTGDVHAGELWIEAARVLKGARHLVSSVGLYERLGAAIDIETDLPDTEEEITLSDRLLASLSIEQWQIVSRKNLRAELLDVADGGNPVTLADWLIEIT